MIVQKSPPVSNVAHGDSVSMEAGFFTVGNLWIPVTSALDGLSQSSGPKLSRLRNSLFVQRFGGRDMVSA